MPRLRPAERGRRAVLFVDAAPFVYGPLLGFVWCLVRLFVPAPAGRQRYRVLGALDAVSKRLIRVCTTGGVNAAAVGDLLRAIAAARWGRPVTLVLDNARYQHMAEVKTWARAPGIELLYLPSYSPNLNLIERRWRFVKKEALASRYRATFGEFTAAIDDCLEHLNSRYRSQMESLITLNFQTFGFEPVLVVAAWFALSIYALLPLIGVGRGITEANGRRIVPGMARAEVEAILGVPNPLPDLARKGEAFWDANTVLGCRYVAILVAYDAEGRVVRAGVSGGWRSSPSWKFW